jgi:hypothetical protein
MRDGLLIAKALRRGWRQPLEQSELSLDRISSITPLLISSGAAGLVWRQIEPLQAARGQSNLALQEAYRSHLLHAAVHELEVTDIFMRARAHEVEPILFKGWALARLYPDVGLRPYGDIDLWVRPEDLEKLYRALPSGDDYSYCVEPHVSFYPQYERSFDEVMSASQLISLNDIRVRIPCDEDHLRFICLHFLYHGGWRPLWLCDIALMVESASSEFDWDRCLSGNRKHADWIACVIGLAHQLLDAEVTGTPVAKRAKNLPGWLAPAVLKQWGDGPGMSLAENLSFSFPRRLLKPAALMRAFREHWRNPIQASVEMNAWFNESPRSLLQFGSAFLKIPEFARFFGQEIRRT